ncbi:hypothetical protein CASFOL_025028 [Castilleja foliolosa]|uniref:Uncharacterized protein n=1 Tax=Castilleja foliolosa TaxID=1961234 RepID=A0ABD3CSH2_9LAMI
MTSAIQSGGDETSRTAEGSSALSLEQGIRAMALRAFSSSAKQERKAYLNELHAESQRLLRETREASFKPIAVVQKPISSVVEKIRKRKLEISKKAMVVNSYGFDGSRSLKDRQKDLDIPYEDKT